MAAVVQASKFISQAQNRYARAQYRQARLLFAAALDLQQKESPLNTLDIINTLHALACTYVAEQRWAEALEPLNQAADIYLSHRPDCHALAATVLNLAGRCHLRQNRLTEAQQFMTQALQVAYLSDDLTKQEEIDFKTDLADCLLELGQTKQACVYYQEIVQKQASTPVLINLAQCYATEGKLDLAETCYQQALQHLIPDSIPKNKEQVSLKAISELAKHIYLQGQYESAAYLYSKLLQLTKVMRVESPEEKTYLEYLADCHAQLGRSKLASRTYQKSAALRRLAQGQSN